MEAKHTFGAAGKTLLLFLFCRDHKGGIMSTDSREGMRRVHIGKTVHISRKGKQTHMKLSELTAYEVLEEKPLEDINSQGYILRHKKSGARVALISNDDDNKVFYIGFRTPPADSTGVAHIVEHTVLCGSEKYPVKDPFVELVKGSLNTFLNAMTYPDKTIYPVASCNDADFANLMSVYMDAVFHPNIYKYREIFEQEGWHYELEEADGPVTINGVVYNEMKGAFSSPDDVLQREIMNSLFPDTAYGSESGGDPEYIPDLTYEDYLDFHGKYYHPCNSYIYLYGDMDMAEKLRWMDEEYLSRYESAAVDSEIREQEAFCDAAEVIRKYPIASDDTESDNTYLSYNLVIGTVLDRRLYQAFDVLDYALLAAPGAPVRQALLDAGIGKDITGGYDSSIRQPIFSVVAKNTNLSEKERFLSIIRETLAGQVKNGINKKALLAGINSSEFRFREADFGQFPKGLLYGIQCLDSWLYDDMQPFLHLEVTDTYRFLREQTQTDYFEKLVERYLLNNTHASVVIAVPERGLGTKREEELTAKLAEYKAGLTEEELAALAAATKHLRAYQEEPSPREELDKIPMLRREDMKREAMPLNNIEVLSGKTKFVHHAMFSGGIDYLTLLFDVRDLSPEELPYLGILKAVLGYVDTENYGYAELANEINIHTGGIGCGVGIYPSVKDNKELEIAFEVRTKVLADKLADAVHLITEIVTGSKLSDDKRLYEILAQLKSRLQAGLSSAGHSVASIRAMAGFSRSAWYQDAVNGIGAYRVIASYEADFQAKKEALAARLSGLIRRIFTEERMTVSVTCAEKDFAAVKREVLKLAGALPAGDGFAHGCRLPELAVSRKNQGFLDASQVQYVARAGNFVSHGFRYHGALKILKVIMGYDYLWIHVRVKGGAYGCMNGYMRNGDTYFVSYRDPNLRATNEVYDGIPRYLEAFEADEREMTKYIIGTVSDMDTPLNPNARGVRSMTAYLQGLTEADIQRERDEVIGATAEDIRGLKDMMEAVLSDGCLCVIGNEDCLRQERALFDSLETLC